MFDLILISFGKTDARKKRTRTVTSRLTSKIGECVTCLQFWSSVSEVVADFFSELVMVLDL